MGYDCSGIITETGRDVKKFNIGDAVYVKLPEVSRGEYEWWPKALVLIYSSTI
jgi:NADPH:quinone reductase-like Zn-dependent oxidoreductase